MPQKILWKGNSTASSSGSGWTRRQPRRARRSSRNGRRGDIPLLARHFLDKAARALDKPRLALSPEALSILEHYPFPGNVRELENILERAAVMADGPSVLPEHLPPDLACMVAVQRVSPAADEPVSLEENERRHIAWVLDHCAGNKTQTAKTLGIDRASLWRKLKRFGLE